MNTLEGLKIKTLEIPTSMTDTFNLFFEFPTQENADMTINFVPGSSTIYDQININIITGSNTISSGNYAFVPTPNVNGFTLTFSIDGVTIYDIPLPYCYLSYVYDITGRGGIGEVHSFNARIICLTNDGAITAQYNGVETGQPMFDLATLNVAGEAVGNALEIRDISNFTYTGSGTWGVKVKPKKKGSSKPQTIIQYPNPVIETK